jgi:chaperonin GroEL (HSP60 family)
VTVSNQIELPDHFQNMGTHLLKQAANTTSDVAGDGTTSSTVRAQHTSLGYKRTVAPAVALYSAPAQPWAFKHTLMLPVRRANVRHP